VRESPENKRAILSGKKRKERLIHVPKKKEGWWGNRDRWEKKKNNLKNGRKGKKGKDTHVAN